MQRSHQVESARIGLLLQLEGGDRVQRQVQIHAREEVCRRRVFQQPCESMRIIQIRIIITMIPFIPHQLTAMRTILVSQRIARHSVRQRKQDTPRRCTSRE